MELFKRKDQGQPAGPKPVKVKRPRDSKKIALGVLAVLVGMLPVYFLGISKRSAILDEKATVDNEVATLRQQITIAERQRSRSAEHLERVRLGIEQLPAQNPIPEYIRTVTRVAEIQGGTNWTSGNAVTGADPGGAVETYTMGAALEGDFDTFLRLLTILRSSERLITLESIQFDGGTNVQEVNFSLQAFGWFQGAALDPATGLRKPAADAAGATTAG